MDFTPVVKYLIIANVVVFLLQIFFTRPAHRRASILDDGMMPDDEEIAPETIPAGKNDQTKTVDRRKRERNARKAREEIEEMMSQLPGMRTSVVQDWFELDPKEDPRGRATLAAGDQRVLPRSFRLWHIVFNMLMLYWFGQRLERMYGSTEFLLFYLAAASVRRWPMWAWRLTAARTYRRSGPRERSWE